MKQTKTKQEITRKIEKSRYDARNALITAKVALAERNPIVLGWRATKIAARRGRNIAIKAATRMDERVRAKPYHAIGLAVIAGAAFAILKGFIKCHQAPIKIDRAAVRGTMERKAPALWEGGLQKGKATIRLKRRVE
jgi:hypothetical protein